VLGLKNDSEKNMKNIILVSVIWIIVIVISFLWNYTNARKEREAIALQTARSVVNLIGITNEWNDRHGGVYVAVTEKIRPNPYVDELGRDIEVNDDLKLTKVNSHYMIRQLSEIAMEREGIEFHLTSIKPIRPQNKPTAREEIYLNEFEKGTKEKGLFVNYDSKPSFFYIAALKTEKACLSCHYNQGYKEGDIRGGISVTLPFNMPKSLSSLLLGHVGIGLVGLFGIINAGGRLSKAYEIIELQAMIDYLTELPNRRFFTETIVREFGRCQRNQEPLSIIMCDIDNFKSYNDTYGHSDGDMCIKKVAQAIKFALKRPGDFCARYGGEEFIVILPDTGPDGAMHTAERIRLNVEEEGITHKNSLPARIVTMSLGVATSEGITTSVSYEELIKHADMALYKAKHQGRNQVNFFSECA
jgi:diguanylate cyclase (GGDEF)-like protein